MRWVGEQVGGRVPERRGAAAAAAAAVRTVEDARSAGGGRVTGRARGRSLCSFVGGGSDCGWTWARA